MGKSRHLFVYFGILILVDSKEKLLVTDFKLRISGVGSTVTRCLNKK